MVKQSFAGRISIGKKSVKQRKVFFIHALFGVFYFHEFLLFFTFFKGNLEATDSKYGLSFALSEVVLKLWGKYGVEKRILRDNFQWVKRTLS